MFFERFVRACSFLYSIRPDCHVMIGYISMYSNLIAKSSGFFSFHLMLLARIDLDPDYHMRQSKGRGPSAEEPHSSTSRRASSRKMTAAGTPQKV